MTRFTVTLPHFEGPLDLLLHLIEKRELDVTTVSLAAVTDEFLRTVREMEQVDPDVLADFLVVAAKLVLIKSKLLLPVEQPEASEEEEGEDLARTLERYRQFKQIAQYLGEREAQGLRSYMRVAPPPEISRRLAPEGLQLGDLMAALQALLQEKEPEPENVDEVVRPLRITVRQRISDLTRQLRHGQPIEFRTLLSERPHRQEIIATFLAMLELLKLGWVRVYQEELWGSIQLVPVAEALPDEEAGDIAAEIDEYI